MQFTYAARKSDRQRAVWARYDGELYIIAIKAIRGMFNIGLKDAKEACEAPYFLIGERDLFDLQDEYNSTPTARVDPDKRGGFVLTTPPPAKVTVLGKPGDLIIAEPFTVNTTVPLN